MGIVSYNGVAVAEASDNRQPLAKNQLAIALLVLVLVVAVGVGLYFLLKSDKKGHKGTNPGNTDYPAFAAKFIPPGQMAAQPIILGEGFYWAGPLPGFKIELRRTTEGAVYVRYMGKGTHEAEPGHFLTIATYPFNSAVEGLKDEAKKEHSRTVKGKHHSIIYVHPHHPQSVYMAFINDPNVEIEVVGTTPAQAAQIANSGRVRPASG